MKKLYLIIGILLLTLAACGGSPSQETAENAEAATTATSVSFITPSVNLTTKENRFVITVWKGGAYYHDVQSLTIHAFDPNQEGHPETWAGPATNYSDYDIPYWVAYPNFTAPGIWRIQAEAELPDGSTVSGTLLARVSEEAESIVAGMPAPQSETRTLNDGIPLLKLTSDATPNEAFYQQTVAEAVTSGQPSLIVFATPGLCTSRICAPVMDSTIDSLWEQYQNDLNFVHVEVYNLETNEYVDAMAEWGLSYEPWVYLVDGTGTVTRRFDGPLAVSEISPAIEQILAGT